MEVLLRRVGILRPEERRAALDRWTGELVGQSVQRGESGAPYLASGVGISVSHTGEWLALAIDRSGGACGVDIELVGRSVERVASRFIGPQELCLSPYAPNAGLWIWCAKEALYKAAGVPSVDWLRDIRVTAADRGTVCGRAFALAWRQEAGLLVVWAQWAL